MMADIMTKVLPSGKHEGNVSGMGMETSTDEEEC